MEKEIKITFQRQNHGIMANANDVALWLTNNKQTKLANKFMEKQSKAEKEMDDKTDFIGKLKNKETAK